MDNICKSYNQYYTDIVDQNGNLVTTKCFDGNEMYLQEKAFKVNNFKEYDNTGYYAWIDENFKDYAFPKEDFDSPDYSEENEFNKICKSVTYSLKQQQKFAGRIFNTNTDIRGMLVYHGLGSGKTQTSIVVGEAFKYRTVLGEKIKNREDSHVFIVVPAALVNQYYAEIIGSYESGVFKSASSQIWIMGNPENPDEGRQYYTDSQVRRVLEFNHAKMIALKREKEELVRNGASSGVVNAKQVEINTYKTANKRLEEDQKTKVLTTYEILSHESFLNKLFIIDSNQNFIPQYFNDVQKGRLDYLNKPNGLLIIDEIQNLVSATGTNYRRLLYALRFHTHPQFRTILLTGTPIYDKPYEFGLLMNLLRPRVIFPDGKDSFNNMFLDGDTFINQNYFKKMCSGYISYFKGGNPISYPYKKTTVMHHKMNEYQYSEYKKALIKEVSKDQKNSLQGIADEDYFINLKNDNATSSGIFSISNQLCNIAFPEVKTRTKSILQDSINEFKKLISAFIKENALLKGRPSTKSMRYDLLTEKILELIGNFSSKFAKVAEMILNCDGTAFVFSNFVFYGVNAMGVIMDFLGFTQYPLPPGPNGRYFIWNGDANSKRKHEVDGAKSLFNNINNMDGSQLKVLFGTQTVMEGVDFKNVNQLHILDPWWNDSRMQQIIARGVRLCSHKNLPPERRFVNVFIHLSTLGSFENVYNVTIIDEHGAKKKVKSFMQIENINAPREEWVIKEAYAKVDKEGNVDIKSSSKYFRASQIVEAEGFEKGPDMHLIKEFNGNNWKYLASRSVQEYMYSRSLQKLGVNRQFEKAIKETAIDCSINKNGNIVRLDEYYTPNIQIDNTWNLFYQNYATGETFVRLNVKSMNPALPPNVFTLDDILQNTALKSGEYQFTNVKTGQVIKTNKMLIFPENIDCSKEKYTFKFPEEIVRLTINNNLAPMLMKYYRSDKNRFLQFLLNVVNKNPEIPLIDKNLPKNLREFLIKNLGKRKVFIEKLKEFGFNDDPQLWDLVSFNDLEKVYNMYILNKN